MTSAYCVRMGDGNEGNYPRFILTLSEAENPWHALHAILVNHYIVGSRTRAHVMRNCQTEGEQEFGITATVYEGPKGEQAFDSAWLTAELEPYSAEDVARCNMQTNSLREALDLGAYRFYCRLGKPFPAL